MAIAPLPDEVLLAGAPPVAPALRLLVGSGVADQSAPSGSRGSCRRGTTPARRARQRRLRLVLVLVGLTVALMVPVRALGGAASATVATRLTHGALYTVEPGDSLWSIARRLDPGADPRAVVARLEARTGSDTIVVGEQIRLP